MATTQDDGSITATEERMADVLAPVGSSAERDIEGGREKESVQDSEDVEWDKDPHNPFNWPAWKKALQVIMISSVALLACVFFASEATLSLTKPQIHRNFHHESRPQTTHG